MGAFIVLEGGEGCGKSTQARLLYARLLQEGHSSLLLHEPGGTTLGEQVRRLLTVERGNAQGGHQGDIDSVAELLLFSAARAELVRKVLRPALEEGHAVVCDRYIASTVAYQGYGRGLSPETVAQANRLSTGGLEPDLTVLLDMPPEDALRRVRAQMSLLPEVAPAPATRRQDEEGHRRFEREPLRFHRKVRQGYLELAASEPERWLVVDGSLPQERIADIIWERVEPLVLS